LPRRIPTNFSSCLGVVRIVSLPRVIFWDLVLKVWDVPIILEAQHSAQDIVAEFHYLFANVAKESIT
jgi:hypothetical protein